MATPRPQREYVESRGPWRYFWWLIVSQRRRTIFASIIGSSWMIGLTLPPYLLSRAIDEGLQKDDASALLGWAGAILGVGILNAWLGIVRHRTMTRVRLDASLRTVRTVVAQATRLGAGLSRQTDAGELVTIGLTDVGVVATTLTVTGPGVGAVFAYAVIAVLLSDVSGMLAVVVLLGVPLLALVLGPLLGRLRDVQRTYRQQQSNLTARLVDMVDGLRILSGVGGKALYAGRYRRESRSLQESGYQVGAVSSWIDALALGLPSLFLAVVTWLAARMAAAGEISVGQLVAVYGYVAVLVVPVASLLESGNFITRGLVAADRIVRFLRLRPDPVTTTGGQDAPAEAAVLIDPESGVEVRPGILTAVVSARPSESAAVIERLGRFCASDVTWGGIGLGSVEPDQVRSRILVADNEAALFAGTVRDSVAGRHEADDAQVMAAIDAAAAADVVRGLTGGIDASLLARGLNLSGGQRQRIRMARALLARPQILLAVEPTSAVDAHTEARMADRLRAARAGRATVVTTTSPLLLDRADEVYFLSAGVVSALGTHRELLGTTPEYRRLVARGEDDGS